MSETTRRQTVTDQALAMVGEHLRDGLQMHEAVQAALGWVKQHNHDRVLLSEVGQRMLHLLYLDQQHRVRRDFRAVATSDEAMQQWATPGPMKWSAAVVSESVAPIFKVTEYVNGARKAFGACDPDDLRWLEQYRKEQAGANERAAAMYRRVRRGVERAKAKNVYEAYRTRIADLVRLYRAVSEAEDE